MNRKSHAAQVAHRRTVVAANLLSGMSYREIATALKGKPEGASPATIARDVQAILAEWRKDRVAQADAWTELQSKRLDRAVNAIWAEVQAGNLAAIDRLQRLIDQQARLLGLDKREALDWRFEVLLLHVQGKLTRGQIEEELGPNHARELFESIGLSVDETGEAAPESR